MVELKQDKQLQEACDNERVRGSGISRGGPP